MEKLIWIFLSLVAAAPAFADKVDTDGPRCDRSMNSASLTDAERKSINEKGYALRHTSQSGYAMSYVFAEAAYDPLLIMGVYASAGEHRKLGGFIKESKLLSPYPAAEYDVRYKQEVSWPYSDGVYTVRTFLSMKNSNYWLNTQLLDSSSADFSPRWADSYLSVSSTERNGSFVVACNFMIPRGDSFKGKFNDTAKSRMNSVAANLLKWVKEVDADSAKAAKHREDLKKALKL